MPDKCEHCGQEFEGYHMCFPKDKVHEKAAKVLKDTNPKDAVGTAKVSMSCVPAPVLLELANAMLEGARKYGRHNYRIAGVRASIYYDAAMRHLMAFWEGEDIDPESGVNHIVKAIACLIVLRDSQWCENWIDDRPPHIFTDHLIQQMNERAEEIIERYTDAKEAFTRLNTSKEQPSQQ